jgi:hypothetical protein
MYVSSLVFAYAFTELISLFRCILVLQCELNKKCTVNRSMHSRCLNYVCLELNTAYMLQTNRLHISRALTREKLTPLDM